MKYILAIVLFLIAATVYFISRPPPEFEVGRETATGAAESVEDIADLPPEDTGTSTEETDPAKSAEEMRIAAMKAEFEKLEKARRDLERRLSRLKAILYGMEIPREESMDITEQMKNGYGLLKNKKLMASYDGPQAISDELARVEYISNYLEEVEDTYRAKRMQQYDSN